MKVGWKATTLGDICQFVGGGTPSKAVKRYWDGKIPWVSPKDMKFDVVSDSIDHISREAIDSSAASLIPTGSVLIVVRSGILARIVPLAITGKDVSINQDLKALIPDKPLDAKFLYYFLQSRMDGLLSLVSRGATVHRLITDDIRSIEVAFPPLPEQKHIVEILDQAFDAIDAATDNVEMSLLNSNELFHSYLNRLFENTENQWKETRLDDICDIRHGFAFDGGDFSNRVPEGHPIVITPGNFTETGTLLFDEKNTKRFKDKSSKNWLFDVGDLVVVMTDLSTKMKILGKPAFVEQDNVLHNQRIGRIIFKSAEVLPRLVYYFMLSEEFLRNIRRSATGTMVRHTAPTRILANRIRYPVSSEDQTALVRRLDALRDQTLRLGNNYKLKLIELKHLRSSALNKAFDGGLH